MNNVNKNNIIWGDVKWAQVSSRVRKIQCRIYKASLKDDIKRVHWLQKFLINSWDGKLLAVRQVTVLNKGKSTAGVDKMSNLTALQKINLAAELKLDSSSAPIRRVWIPKPGKTEKRPLGIPNMRDRANQALAKMALEPQWEAVFEANSYGFRPGRGCHDSIEAIFLNLHHDRPKWVYDADIRKCFDKIEHNALLEKLNTFPQMKQQIRAWLRAGVMEGYANTPKDVEPTLEGTPQGGVISPLLANIALHGLEIHLNNFVAKLPIKPNSNARPGRAVKMKALGFVRYADDFLLIHENRVILDLCVEETKLWLKQMGLEISEEKSAVKDSREGFNFLGFHITLVRKIHRMRYKVKITPSRVSKQRFLHKIREIIQRNKAASSYSLISKLRPVIIGWGNYYRYCECKDVFGTLTNAIFQKLRAWAFRRDTRNGRIKVKEKYFPVGKTYSFHGKKHEDNWILCGTQKIGSGGVKENFLPHLVWIPSAKHVKVKGTESPYSRSHYWALRSAKHSPYPLRVRELLVRQRNRCPFCKSQFNIFDSVNWEVDHIIPRFAGGKDEYSNLQLLHKECHEKKTALDLQKYKDLKKKGKRKILT
jgi:RNA-directed DNA polymerase